MPARRYKGQAPAGGARWQRDPRGVSAINAQRFEIGGVMLTPEEIRAQADPWRAAVSVQVREPVRALPQPAHLIG